MEFNPDGSLKIPEKFKTPLKRLNIRKDILSEYAPKKCRIHVTGEPNLVEKIICGFQCETPIKLSAYEDRHEIEIGSDFKRCSDCRELVYKLSAIVQGDCHIDNGTCTAKGIQQKFCYEDYFTD
jgi:hypothetical protein